MATSRERIQSIAGQSRSTTPEAAQGLIPTPDAKDERGILRELDSGQIEKMSRDQVLDYQRRRSEQIEQRRAQAAEEDDFRRYQETFVGAGGREKDARAAWETQKRLAATEAAQQASTETLNASRRRVRQGL